MRPRKIPSYPLSEYAPKSLAEHGIFVGRFEALDAKLNRPGGAHRHEHFELFWLRGPAEHVNDFDRFVLPAKRPSFVLVSPGQLHSWRGTERIRGTLVSFTQAFYEGRETQPNSLLEFSYVDRAEHPPLLVADSIFAREGEPLIRRCEQEYEARAERWEDVLRATLHVLMALAQRAYRRASPAPNGRAQKSHRLLRVFRAQVERRFRETSSVSSYARALGVSSGHLNDTIKALSGSTAGDYIRTRIMLEARRLLAHSGMSVSEVAYHLGFADPSYFAKSFRRATGRSPVAFREDYQSTRE